MGGKENMDSLWPLSNTEKTSSGFEKPTKEWWDKMKEAQKKVDEKILKERNVKR